MRRRRRTWQGVLDRPTAWARSVTVMRPSSMRAATIFRSNSSISIVGGFFMGFAVEACCRENHGFSDKYDGRGERIRTSGPRSEEHTSELQSLMRTSYAAFCLYKQNNKPH